MLRKKFYTLFAAIIFFTKLSAQNPGDTLFQTLIHTVNINFSQTGFWDSLLLNYANDVYMAGSVNIDGKQLNSIGIKLKGNSSFNTYPGVKKSMKLSFNEYQTDQRFDSLKTLNLNNGFKDPTMMREKIMLDFCRRNGVPAPRCVYAKVYINGTYWGFYTLVEQVDKKFLGTNFSNNDGNLFKGDPKGDLKWLGSSPSLYYNSYELKTNETTNDWTDLVNLIDKINNTSDGVFYDSLENNLETNYYLKVWASNNLFANLDSYIGSGHNYYIYHDENSNKFNTITWDVNEAFGNFNMGMNVTQIENLSVQFLSSPSNSRPLSYRMLQNATYKTAYLDLICNWMQSEFTTEKLFSIIDSFANLIRTDYYADPNKMYSNQQFEDNIDSTITVTGGPGGNDIPGLKSFINRRRTAVQTELAALTCPTAISEVENSSTGFNIFPNPTNGKVWLRITNWNESRNFGTNEELELRIYNLFGQEVFKSTIRNPQSEMQVDLPNGIYFVRLQDTNKIQSRKLQIIR